MRQIYMLIGFSILSFSGFSQIQVKPVLKISSTFSFFGISSLEDYNNDIYFGINGSAGIQLEMKSGVLNILGSYQFSGQPKYNYFSSYFKPPRSHLVGGTIEYHFRNNNTRFSPFIDLSILTEVATNYDEFYFNDDYDITGLNEIQYSLGSHGGPPYYTEYYSNFYYSTPFVGSVIAGCDFCLMKDLHLNLGVGYGLRIMKTKYAEWGENDDVNEILWGITPVTHYFHMLDVQLGLSYAISFHKKEKTQPE